MSRSTISKKLAVVSSVVLLVASLANGAEIFRDDFTNSSTFHSKWINVLSDDMMSVTVGGGSASVNNTSDATGLYLHTLAAPKPEVFTISYTLKSVTGSGDAGVFFCRNSSGTSGYMLTIRDNRVALFKYIDGGGKTIFYETSPNLNASDNKLTVSKNSSGNMRIFLNDVWLGDITDTEFPSGDIALYVSHKTAAVFGAFEMTDEFITEGGMRTWFSDDFSGGKPNYWKADMTPNSDVLSTYDISGGVLTITTPVNSAGWTYVDIDLSGNDFEISAAVRHVSGGTTTGDFYGIILLGSTPSSQMLYFGVSASRRWGAWKSTDGSITPSMDASIRGNLIEPFIDTLIVRKKAGASTYEFLVNGTLVSESQQIAEFPIVAAGLFTSPNEGGITVDFDDFYAGPIDRSISIIWGGRNPHGIRSKSSSVKVVNPVFYDLRGRRSYSKATPKHNMRTRAAGVYVNESGREVMVRRGRR